jgi:hypothetical protein
MKKPLNIKLDAQADRELQRVMPRHLRGKRKAAIRVHEVIREYVTRHGEAKSASGDAA